MSDIEPEKLKVVELRKELTTRGLESKGNKPILVKRLKQALNKERGIEVADADVSIGELDTSQEDSQDESQLEELKTASEVAQATETADDAEDNSDDVEEAEEAINMEKPENGTAETKEETMETDNTVKSETQTNEIKIEADTKEETMETDNTVKTETQNNEDIIEAETKEETDNTVKSETQNNEIKNEVDNKKPTPSDDKEADQMQTETSETKADVSGDQPAEAPEEDDDGLPEEFQTIDETNDDDTEEKKDDKDRERRPSKRQRSRSRSPRRSRDRTRRSRSRERRRESPKVVVEEEDDGWLQSTTNQLDRYNADLNLRVDENGLKAHPLTVEGFAFMWAGVRGMYGVKAGKVAFEVKIVDNLKVEHLPSEESKNVVRVGWSADSSSLQLGEEPLSYGYGGTGKASVDCKFKDYGTTFTAGDVVTSYLDLESDPATVAYSKNGEYQEVCFEINKEDLGDQALFPHILTKNTEFEVNFGSLETPWFPLQEGFVFLETLGEDEKVRGSVPPAKKEECEIIMMVGLPAGGKTHWANKHSAANPDKKYNILGTNNIIDKMKVMGLPRKKNYAGRWDSLIEKSMRCLNRLIEISARKRRNYILDQTNVYASARRRKMQPFEGFQRKAVVIIPSDEDFKSRIAETEKEEGKDVPEKAVLEMKANFTLPEVGSLYDTVEFTELDQEEGGKLVEKYMKEAKAALPPPEKRFRNDRWGSSRGRSDNRGSGYGGYRGGGGGYRGDRDRYGGGGYGGRGGYRGYRDGGYKDGGYRGSYQGSRGSSNRYDSSSRHDSKGRYDNRSGGSKSWETKPYDSRNSAQGSWGGRQGSWGGSSAGWGGQGQWGSQSGYGSGYNQGGYGSTSQGYGTNQQWGAQTWNQNYWTGQTGTGYNQGSAYNQWYGSYK